MAVNNLTVARWHQAVFLRWSYRTATANPTGLQLSLWAVMREYVCPAVRQRAR